MLYGHMKIPFCRAEMSHSAQSVIAVKAEPKYLDKKLSLLLMCTRFASMQMPSDGDAAAFSNSHPSAE